MSTLLRVFRYTRRYPLMATGTLSCALVSTLMVAVFPNVTQRIVDQVIQGGQHQLLLPLSLTALGAFILRDGLNALRIILNNSFEQKVIYDLRSDLYQHMQWLPLHWFDDRATGDLMTRVVEDVNSVERVLIDGIEQGSVAVLQILVVAGLLFFYDPLLAGIALLPVPFLIGGALAYTLTAQGRYRAQRRSASAMNAILHDNLAGIRQIKTFVQEESQHRRFNEASGNLMQTTLRVMRAWAIYSPSMSFLSNIGLVLITGFGAYGVIQGRLDVGAFVAFLTASRFLYEPIERLHSLNQLMQSGRAAGERVFEILDTEIEPDEAAEAEAPVDIEGRVEYRDVSFSYQDDVPVLKHISLAAEPGQTIALVGPTGAGKSTIVSLLNRFYEYDDGEILIDGTPLRDLPRPVLRSLIGVVTQEAFLFNGSVRANLQLGHPEASDEAMWEALAAANAEEFVRDLPEGIETVVGERGVKLSVGQKQRVSIARVLLKNPPILILDEATSSVDNETERLIQQALDRLLQKRTAFVIAHRLSTIRHADQILVLRAGRIVERGRHEDLLAAGGLYARLHQHGEQDQLAGAPTAKA